MLTVCQKNIMSNDSTTDWNLQHKHLETHICRWSRVRYGDDRRSKVIYRRYRHTWARFQMVDVASSFIRMFLRMLVVPHAWLTGEDHGKAYESRAALLKLL